MSKNIGIIGGDLRILKLIELLKEDGYNVYTYNMNINNDSNNLSNISKLIDLSDYIVSGIPISKDEKTVTSIYNTEKIYLEDIVDKMKNKTFIAGKISNKIVGLMKQNGNVVYDLMEDEVLTINNAVSTVEGTISKIISNTEKNIYESDILILGYGRIGKLLAERLEGFKANVFCEARNEKDLTWIKTSGFTPIYLNDLKQYLETIDFDVIVNTVPEIILDKKLLDLVNKKTYIVDLASKPGGLDFDYADSINLNYEWTLAVPGKVAPTSSAKYIKESLEKIIEKVD